MTGINTIIAMAILVEALVSVVKLCFPSKVEVPSYLWQILSIVFGVVLCVATQTDALPLLHINVAWHFAIGQIVTGVLVSRGSNFLHDIIAKINTYFEPVINEGVVEELPETEKV